MQKKIKKILDQSLNTNNKKNETIALLKIIESELIRIEYTDSLLMRSSANKIVNQTNEITGYRLLLKIIINRLTEELNESSTNINILYDIYEEKYRPDLRW